MIFDPSDRLCVPSQSKKVNVTVFNMISKKKIESKTLQKHFYCDVGCTLDEKNITKIKDGIFISVNGNVKKQKKTIYGYMLMFGIEKYVLMNVIKNAKLMNIYIITLL